MDAGPARYDDVADQYEAMFADRVDDPATAALLDLVGDLDNRKVVDIPCGSGRLAREMARRGAQLVGVDISNTFVDRARSAELAEPLGIVYHLADATSPQCLAGEVFDVVVCNYGLSDIDDLDAYLATVARLLRPSGVFAFSILHPCFPGLGDTVSSAWPPTGYHDERFWRADGAASDLRRQVGSNHRKLSSYLNHMTNAGLVIEELAEPSLGPELIGPSSVPMFLAGRCRLSLS